MKSQLSYLVILFVCIVFLPGCEAEITPKEYPFIVMQGVETSDSGALFRAEVLNLGSYTVQSYGFVWSTTEPNIEDSDTILISTPFAKGTFEIEVDYGLAKGLTYTVRPFAIYNETTVYGTKISFNSLGSQRNGWSLVIPENPDLEGWFSSYGSAIDGKGLILYQSDHAYYYDPSENRYSRAPDFPVSGNSGSRFTSVSFNQALYFFNDIDLNLYKFENDIWTNESEIPYRYDRFNKHYQSLSTENSVMLLSSYESYEYNIQTKSWIDRSPLPISNGYSVGGTSTGGKAYVLTSDNNLWEYDSDTHLWKIRSEYPGRLRDRIISFSFEDKIYFGLSYDKSTNEPIWLNKEFWSFDLTQETWKLEDPFPLDLKKGDLHHFFVNGKLYIGHEFGTFEVWVFDPAKN